MSHPPVIIIGMHRSGTGLVARLLENLGLFMGIEQGVNHEALFFQRINRSLLQESGGSWDNPESIDRLLADSEVRSMIVEYIRFVLRTPRAAGYMGWRNYLRTRDLMRLDELWGWKDPRNTFTLSIWLDLFPDAKVIHVYRNGVDVANSLKKRGNENLHKYAHWKSHWRTRLRFVQPVVFPRSSAKHLTLAQGFALWEVYMARADRHLASLSPGNALAIQYETLLQNPSPVLQDLRGFVGLSAPDGRLSELAATVNPQRAFAYKDDEDLAGFYDAVKQSPQMVKYGYG